MRTGIRNILGAVALVAATSFITAQVVSQDQPPQDDQWQEWMKYAEPGPEHERLSKHVGTWEQETTFWMYPGAEAQTSASTATVQPMLGGRFFMEKVEGEAGFLGMPEKFEGLGLHGFDRTQDKYVFAWADNMGTMIMTGEGTADESGKVITYYSEMPDPIEGGTVEMKSVTRMVSDEEYIYEMYHKQPDGSWFKNMKLVAKKK